jgi:hypothetical protein
MRPKLIGVMLLSIGILAVLILLGFQTSWYIPVIIFFVLSSLFVGTFLTVFGDDAKKELKNLWEG